MAKGYLCTILSALRVTPSKSLTTIQRLLELPASEYGHSPSVVAIIAHVYLLGWLLPPAKKTAVMPRIAHR